MSDQPIELVPVTDGEGGYSPEFLAAMRGEPAHQADALPAIERPNGKLYRPKKVQGRLLNEATDEPTLILITGTHDVDSAADFARELAAYWLGSDVQPVAPMRGWWRQSIRRGEEYWADDDVRGAAGVVFSVEEIPQRWNGETRRWEAIANAAN